MCWSLIKWMRRFLLISVMFWLEPMFPAACGREAVYSLLKVGHCAKEWVSSSCLKNIIEVSRWLAGTRVQNPGILFSIEAKHFLCPKTLLSTDPLAPCCAIPQLSAVFTSRWCLLHSHTAAYIASARWGAKGQKQDGTVSWIAPEGWIAEKLHFQIAFTYH